MSLIEKKPRRGKEEENKYSSVLIKMDDLIVVTEVFNIVAIYETLRFRSVCKLWYDVTERFILHHGLGSLANFYIRFYPTYKSPQIIPVGKCIELMATYNVNDRNLLDYYLQLYDTARGDTVSAESDEHTAAYIVLMLVRTCYNSSRLMGIYNQWVRGTKTCGKVHEYFSWACAEKNDSDFIESVQNVILPHSVYTVCTRSNYVKPARQMFKTVSPYSSYYAIDGLPMDNYCRSLAEKNNSTKFLQWLDSVNPRNNVQ